jgi:hypothetical protein
MMTPPKFELVQRASGQILRCTVCGWESLATEYPMALAHARKCALRSREDMPTRYIGQTPIPRAGVHEFPTDPIEPLVMQELADSRTKTRETKQTIIVDLEDGTTNAVAAFLEFVALAVRERRQLRITVE